MFCSLRIKASWGSVTSISSVKAMDGLNVRTPTVFRATTVYATVLHELRWLSSADPKCTKNPKCTLYVDLQFWKCSKTILGMAYSNSSFWVWAIKASPNSHSRTPGFASGYKDELLWSFCKCRWCLIWKHSYSLVKSVSIVVFKQ